MSRLTKTRESVEYLEYLRARDLQESAHLQEQDHLRLQEEEEEGELALAPNEQNIGAHGRSKLFGTKEKEIKVGIASVLELKAELSKREAQAAQSQIGGQEKVEIIPTATRFKGMAPNEKVVPFPLAGKQGEGAVRNKGIEDRNLKDLSHPNHDEQSKLEASWTALQRKAKIYEQMQEDGGLGRNQDDDDDLLVDFLSKSMHERNGGLDAMKKGRHSSSRGSKEHLLAAGPSKRGEWVQITDEFGRDRLVRAEEADQMRASMELSVHYQDNRQGNYYNPQQDAADHQDVEYNDDKERGILYQHMSNFLTTNYTRGIHNVRWRDECSALRNVPKISIPPASTRDKPNARLRKTL